MHKTTGQVRIMNRSILSEALKAAAVSVVKSGFPMPAPIPPKITTLPFSR
jgi:hypothetical protein